MTDNLTDFRGIAVDSRDVQPGFLFAALPGTHENGARYIRDAIARGAVAVLGAPDAAEEARVPGVRFIADSNPRRRLALMAARFYGAQPACIAAVTGTNGKTSVASFLRQIWMEQGQKAASIGTLGIVSPSGHDGTGYTTPDAVRLHAALARLKREGVEHVALEASSHGLDQFRLDGVRLQAAGFTNITRDHLDYHGTFERYLAAKARLFESLVIPGGAAVINADAAQAGVFSDAAKRAALRVMTVGAAGTDVHLVTHEAHADGQTLTVRYDGRMYTIALPLAGSFQASNALVAAGLALGLGGRAEEVFPALEHLRGAPGRLELAARAREGAPVYVDYAHTPDAVETVLRALRPHVRGRLHIVFGCGGDRDRGKRPLMGEAAQRYAGGVIVTDDNPRSEDASAIRRAVLEGCPGAAEIGDRAEAIRAGIARLEAGDALVIAGKGHEDGQIVGTQVFPFSDRAEAVKAALALGGTEGARP